MRRIIAFLTVFVVVSALVAPTALAERGGNGRSNGVGRATAPGQVKKSETPRSQESTSGAADHSTRGKGNAYGRSADSTGTAQRTREESGTTARDRERSGIATALARIEVNIAKAEEKILSGKKKQVPPGLLKVQEKFSLWLEEFFGGPDGGSPEDVVPDPSDPVTDTVEPDEGETEPGDAGS